MLPLLLGLGLSLPGNVDTTEQNTALVAAPLEGAWLVTKAVGYGFDGVVGGTYFVFVRDTAFEVSGAMFERTNRVWSPKPVQIGRQAASTLNKIGFLRFTKHGTIYRGIYRIDGDTLLLGYSLNEKTARPTTLGADKAQPGVMFLTLKKTSQ